MKLFRSTSPFISLQNARSVFRISTDADPSSSAESSPFNSLFARVAHDVDRRVSISPILEKWIDDGNQVYKRYLQGMVKKLRQIKRFAHALEVSMWMSDRRYFPLSAADHADRLDLIYKVHGLEHAESYFNIISKQSKAYQTYGALLSCYAQEQSVDKAESLFQTMKELNILTSFPYNILMALYSRTGQHEKVETVFQEMNERGINPDAFTDSILLNAYAAALNIRKMEDVLRRTSRSNAADFHTYAVAARAYVKAGIKDKALEKLRIAEKQIPRKNGRYAWGFLITMYADIGSKNEMCRIWNAHKSLMEKASNSMYLCMVSGLLKLDDISGAEALFEEWKSQAIANYDIRIPKLLISAYCKKGLVSKAECLAREAVQSGEMLSSVTWGKLADGYFEVDEIPKAVEMMKKVGAGVAWWKPSVENVDAGLKHFQENGDVEGADEFVMLVRKHIPLTKDVYRSLMKIYLKAGRPVSGLLDQMKADNFDDDEETDKILEGRSENLLKA